MLFRSFFGDGATNIGSVYEAMNLAVVLKLPKIFVIEDNGWGEMTPIANATGNHDLAARAAAMGMPAVSVDGVDFFAVHAAAGEAIARARRGGGPSTLVASAPRFYGHHEGDPQLYRSREEVADLRRAQEVARLVVAHPGPRFLALPLEFREGEFIGFGLHQPVAHAANVQGRAGFSRSG